METSAAKLQQRLQPFSRCHRVDTLLLLCLLGCVANPALTRSFANAESISILLEN